MTEWNIQSRSHACQACEAPFTDRQPYHTLLFDEKSGYARIDVCPGCWESQYSQGAKDRKGFISHWQGVYLAPPPPDAEPIHKEGAETLLRKLIEANDPQYGSAIYILAAMLERKRVLKVINVQARSSGNGRAFVYEHARTGDILTIKDPDLQLDQLEAVQHEVAMLMEYGLSGPPPTVADGYLAVPAQPPVAALGGDVAVASPVGLPAEQPAVTT